MTIAIAIPAHDLTDGDLLSRFIAASDQSAFEELVHRHVHWIYAAALRITRNPAFAEDITQAVLWSLAKKARTLAGRQYLGGWLHEATRYAATTLLREERRRKERERVIAQQIAAPARTIDWEEIQPRLDQAIARLPASDRNAVLLRYLQRKSYEEIGALLGSTPEAARKKVARALERLRHKLVAEGKPEALGAALVAGADIKAPSHLAAAILAGNISARAALLAKGVIVMQKALVLKLAFAAAVVTVCTGYVVESFTAAQSTPPTPSVAQPAAAPAAAQPTAPGAAPTTASPPTPVGSVNLVLTPSARAIPSADGNPPQVIIMDGSPIIIGGLRSGGGGGAGSGGGMTITPSGGGGFFAGGGTAGGVSVSYSSNGTTTTRHINNNQYDITLQTTGNATTVQIKDPNGKEIYSGPFMTDADKAKVPADALPLIDSTMRPRPFILATPVQFDIPNPLSLDSIKQQLGATDAEWADLQDRVSLIMTLQRYLAAGSSAPAMPGRGPAVADTNAENPILAPVRDLTTALADKETKPEDLDAKVGAVREARQQIEDSLAKNRQKLEATVTPRQKALLINLQILE